MPQASRTTYHLPLTTHRLPQTYRAKGVGAAFLSEAVPRLQVFWGKLYPGGLSTTKGDLLCLAEASPPIPFAAPLGGGAAASSRLEKRPEPGVYIRGIWVRKPIVPGAVMAFAGQLNVSGRDRNDVDMDELLDASLQLLARCDERATLRSLLEPLRDPNLPPSWLTKPAASRFLTPLLETDPDFFRHEARPAWSRPDPTRPDTDDPDPDPDPGPDTDTDTDAVTDTDTDTGPDPDPGPGPGRDPDPDLDTAPDTDTDTDTSRCLACQSALFSSPSEPPTRSNRSSNGQAVFSQR